MPAPPTRRDQAWLAARVRCLQRASAANSSAGRGSARAAPRSFLAKGGPTTRSCGAPGRGTERVPPLQNSSRYLLRPFQPRWVESRPHRAPPWFGPRPAREFTRDGLNGFRRGERSSIVSAARAGPCYGPIRQAPPNAALITRCTSTTSQRPSPSRSPLPQTRCPRAALTAS
jgi:hypothetical protein